MVGEMNVTVWDFITVLSQDTYFTWQSGWFPDCLFEATWKTKAEMGGWDQNGS
jgi:hypothetical protein